MSDDEIALRDGIIRRLEDGWESYWTENGEGRRDNFCWTWFDRDAGRPDEPMTEAERQYFEAFLARPPL